MDVIYKYYINVEPSIVSAEYALDQLKDRLWETNGVELKLDFFAKAFNPMYQSWLEGYADEVANEEGVYFIYGTPRKERAEFVRQMLAIDYDYYCRWKCKFFWEERPSTVMPGPKNGSLAHQLKNGPLTNVWWDCPPSLALEGAWWNCPRSRVRYSYYPY